MPNLHNPIKLNTFGYIKFIKAMHNNFYMSVSTVNNPIKGASFYNTNLNAESIYLKIGNEAREVFGAMTLEKKIINNTIYYIIKMVVTNSKYLKQGVVKALYERAIELDFKLASDESQTTFGSKDLWQKFQVYFPQKTIFIFNITNTYKRKFANQNEYAIWGKEEDEDFDILEEEDKIYLIEELYDSNVISIEQKKFFIKNIAHLEDKRNIRLSIE